MSVFLLSIVTKRKRVLSCHITIDVATLMVEKLAVYDLCH